MVIANPNTCITRYTIGTDGSLHQCTGEGRAGPGTLSVCLDPALAAPTPDGAVPNLDTAAGQTYLWNQVKSAVILPTLPVGGQFTSAYAVSIQSLLGATVQSVTPVAFTSP
jgi:hypothetical protein